MVSASINKYAWASVSFRKDKKIILKDSYSKNKTFKSKNDLKYGSKLDLLIAVVKNMHKSKSGIELKLRGDIPARSGLGSSASAFTSLIGVFNHQLSKDRLTDYEMAEMAYRLEREELGNLGGRQDQYSSVFGGINFIEFKGEDFVRVNPIRMSKGNIMELEKNMVLVHVMDRKKSGDIIRDQVSSYVSGKKSVSEALDNVKALACETHMALRKGDLERFGHLLHRGWEQKKRFSPMITNEYIDRVYALARKRGAIGGKLLGAGGGGHMLLYCDDGREEDVIRAVSGAGTSVRSMSLDFDGLTCWEV